MPPIQLKVIPVCGILGHSLEKTFQECATTKYFKNVLTAVSFQECAASPPCGSIFLPLRWLPIERTIGSKSAAVRRVCGLGPADPHTTPARFDLDLGSDGG